MKARAIYTACEQVGPDNFKQVHITREVELPDDFLTPDGMFGIHFIGLSFENEKISDRMNKEAEIGKPRRNCDVGTAEEQDERFKNFCRSYYEPCNVDSGCWRCPLFKVKIRCPIAWAQMPYETVKTNKTKTNKGE